MTRARKRAAAPVIFLVGAALIASASVPAFGAPEGAEADTYIIPATADLAIDDIDSLVTDIALVSGRELTEVRAEIEAGATDDSLYWQNDFNAAVTEVQEVFPAQFANAGIDQASDTAWVSFKGVTPPTFRTVLGALPVDLTVREHLGYSEEELVAAGQELHYSLLDQTDIAATVDTDIDSAMGTVTAYVEAVPTTIRSEVSDKIASRLDTGLQGTLASGIVFNIVVTESLSGGDEDVYGGGHLSTCTAGFSVRTADRPNGLITAAHCGNSQNYGSIQLTFKSAHAGENGDVQWHTTGGPAARPRFYNNTGTLRDLNATANASSGTAILHYGKTTGRTSDEVYRTNQCRGIYCGLTMNHRHHTETGDSGGPWYWGNTGYGVHSGWKTYLAIERSMFTPVRMGADALNVTVKIQ